MRTTRNTDFSSQIQKEMRRPKLHTFWIRYLPREEADLFVRHVWDNASRAGRGRKVPAFFFNPLLTANTTILFWTVWKVQLWLSRCGCEKMNVESPFQARPGRCGKVRPLFLVLKDVVWITLRCDYDCVHTLQHEASGTREGSANSRPDKRAIHSVHQLQAGIHGAGA
jgi:hypothetical protein